MQANTSAEQGNLQQMLTESPAWQAVLDQYQRVKDIPLSEWFQLDANRAKRYCIELDNLYLDYSKNHIDDTCLTSLLTLAKDADLEKWREQLFSGQQINHSEQRPALHTALRGSEVEDLNIDGLNVSESITNSLDQMQVFTQQVHSGNWLSAAGKPIQDVINIGIGGSYLGPKLLVNALKPFHVSDLNFHFVSGIDSQELNQVLKKIDADTCLFIVSSKSFTTSETMKNAQLARDWLRTNASNKAAIDKQLLAVTANRKAALEYGINKNLCFEFWPWIGGRYSVWSVVGLPAVLAIGMENFKQLLTGANLMDEHFKTATLQNNMPVILALLSIWYCNFFAAQTHAIIPYAHGLNELPDYLQQLEMESNGKSVDRHGNKLDTSSAPITWGGKGTQSQHTFFQLLHQGTHLVPCDFITVLNNQATAAQENLMLANFLAQTSALMLGTDNSKNTYKHQTGNQPSNSILLNQLTPKSLGMLLALYEHKVFTQAVILGINPFDQWGVELGKTLATHILKQLDDGQTQSDSLDPSTRQLIALRDKWSKS